MHLLNNGHSVGSMYYEAIQIKCSKHNMWYKRKNISNNTVWSFVIQKPFQRIQPYAIALIHVGHLQHFPLHRKGPHHLGIPGFSKPDIWGMFRSQNSMSTSHKLK